MRQVIHGCSKWRHRDHNDAVPILILIIDLQRSIAKHPTEYEGVDDLVAVYLRLTIRDSDRSRFLMLMQAYASRRALLLLDGVDEGGDAKSRIEDFITVFLVRQRVPLIVTSRPEVRLCRPVCSHSITRRSRHTGFHSRQIQVRLHFDEARASHATATAADH